MSELLVRLFIKNHTDIKNPEVRKKYGFFSSIVGITVNIILASIKLVIGILTFSIAIIADALNNLSDAASSVISMISFKMAAKPADKDHPFGHARIEYIASMIVSFLILVVGFETLSSAVSTALGFSETKAPSFSVLSLVIIGASILLKLWLGLFYRKIGKVLNSSVIRASAADSLMDCISTTAVLVSSVIVKYTKIEIIDSIVGIGVAVVIMIAGISILNETKNSILGESPVKEVVDSINDILKQYPDIIGVHDLMVHNYGPNRYIASLHAEVDGKNDIYLLHDTIDNAEKQIQNELNILCTIHLDPIVTDDEVVNELKQFVTGVISDNFDDNITIHDFRVVIGKTHTNIIFDAVLPFESKETEETLSKKICELVNTQRPHCFCVITVDRN